MSWKLSIKEHLSLENKNWISKANWEGMVGEYLFYFDKDRVDSQTCVSKKATKIKSTSFTRISVKTRSCMHKHV